MTTEIGMTPTPDKELARAIRAADEALALPGDERRLRELLYHYRLQRAEGRERLFQALAMLAITLKTEVALRRRSPAA